MCVVSKRYLFYGTSCLFVFSVSWPGNPFAKAVAGVLCQSVVC